jgi:hypothetical protein
MHISKFILSAAIAFMVAALINPVLADSANAPKTKEELQALNPTELSSEEILALVKGKKIALQYFAGKYKNTLKVTTYHEDGTLLTVNKGEKSGKDSGKWRVSENKLCTQWSRWGKGKEFCKAVYKHPHGYSTTGKYGAYAMYEYQ